MHGLRGFSAAVYSEAFILATVLFFCFYSVIGYLFEMFVDRRVSVLFSVLPSILLFILLGKTSFPFAGIAAVAAALLRLFFALIPWKKEILTAGSFLLTAGALYLHLGKSAQFAGKIAAMLIFVFLAVLTLSAVQKIFYEKRKDAYPFYFFVIMASLISFIPKPEKSINWSAAVEAGERFVSNIEYYMPDLFGSGSYKTGYSNMSVTGGKVSLSDTSQLRLTTWERPYIIYEDEEGAKMKRRKTLYLSGGRGSEKDQIAAFINLLNNAGVDKDTAALFSEFCTLNLEYDYLKTPDEIAPLNSLALTSDGRRVSGGRSALVHKKGYTLTVNYLNIDYGSPYLADIIRKSQTGDGVGYSGAGLMSFEEANDYFRHIYGPKLSDYVSEDEYNRACASGFTTKGAHSYTDTSGASERLKALADVLTEGASCDYDKCKLIEQYLRQYTYSVDVEGDGKTYDITEPEDAAFMAERFLFETGEGYCVHFASSMVTLLRLSGIPARVSVGYHYVFPFDKQDFYEVSGRCAHAWPEAYIENVGWVPFEPTSAYRSAEENSWNRVLAEESGQAVNPYVPGVAPAVSSFDKELKEEEVEEVSLWKELLRVGLPVFGNVVGLLFILFLGTLAVRKIRYNLASLDKKLEMDVNRIKRLIRKQSEDKFEDRGLLSDYLDRVPEELKASAKAVFGTYYRMIYGGENVTPVTETEVRKAEEFCENIQKKHSIIAGQN